MCKLVCIEGGIVKNSVGCRVGLLAIKSICQHGKGLLCGIAHAYDNKKPVL